MLLGLTGDEKREGEDPTGGREGIVEPRVDAMARLKSLEGAWGGALLDMEGCRFGRTGLATDERLNMSDRSEAMMGCCRGVHVEVDEDESTRLLTTATLCLVCSGGLASFGCTGLGV